MCGSSVQNSKKLCFETQGKLRTFPASETHWIKAKITFCGDQSHCPSCPFSLKLQTEFLKSFKTFFFVSVCYSQLGHFCEVVVLLIQISSVNFENNVLLAGRGVSRG